MAGKAEAAPFLGLFLQASVLDFGGPDGLRASERLDPGLLQIDEALQVVCSYLPVQVQRGARQADRTQGLPTHLRQAGEDMLDAGAGLGDAAVAALLGLGDRLVLAALALNLHPPALLAQPRFTLAIDIALVGQDVPICVGRVEHVLEMRGVVFAGRAHFDLAYQLVALVGVGRDLVAEIGFAVLLRPARVRIFLAPLGWLPVGRHRAFADQGFFFLAQRLPGRLHDARVDHLAAARNIAMLGQLTIDRFENALAGARLDEAFLERPDRRSIWNLAAGTQADEALKAQTIKQLELHLLIAQVEQLLDQKHAHHQFGGERWTAAAFAAGTRCRMIDFGGKGNEVDMLLQHPQRIAELVQLGFALLVGKQTGLDHENLRQVRGDSIMTDSGGFFEVPRIINLGILRVDK